MIRAFAVAALLLTSLAGSAQSLSGYRVLLPVFFEDPVPGQFGSRWQTAYAVHNPTKYPFHVEWCPGSVDPQFDVCTRPLLPNAHIAAGETETTLPPFSHELRAINDRGGPRLLYIRPFFHNAASPSELTFALRAFDVSRSATNAGTEVPAVREEQFRRTATNLLNVPTDPAFRLTLRLYETKLRVSVFTARVFDQSNNALLGEKDLVLSWHFAHHWKNMYEPPYLQIGDIGELLPRGTRLPATLRVEIQPRTPGSEFWAFISVTNNETQHLTLVTPQ